MPDKRFVEAYREIELDPDSAARIWARLEQELPPREEKHSMKKMKKPVRIALVAALIAVMMIGSAYALSGIVHSTGSHYMHGQGEYSSLSDLPKVVKTAGYPITAVEEFSNGYTFRQMNLGGEAAFDENNQPIEEYYGVMFTYAKPGSPDMTVSVSPVLNLPGVNGAPPEPTELRQIDGVDVRLNLDHYKLVPPDYEKTEADLAREAAGHYYISFGSAAVEEHEFAFAGFVLDGVEYTLMDGAASASSLETLASMAAELIAASRG